MKYFDTAGNRLVFMEEEASPKYWDRQWDVENFEKTVKDGIHNRLITKTTLRFIHPTSSKKILEGGCGNGQFVYAFHTLGYDSYGVDYAQKTIDKIQNLFPELKVRIGDVRHLDFPDAYFDGYWSIGVIEHFFDGYESILNEIQRVIKPGGFLFITFPYLSPLRKIKIKLGCYPIFNKWIAKQSTFYQFALEHHQIIRQIEKHHFALIQKTPYAGTKGLKDEISLLRPLLQKIYDSKNVLLKIVSYGISILFSPFSSHSILLVFQNTDFTPKRRPRRTPTLWEFPLFKTINKIMIGIFCWINNFSYKVISFLAIRINGGIHPKHEISDYHTFFIDHVSENDSVLDIGYGSGFVAYNIAQKARKVTGIDILDKNIILAKKEYHRDNMTFVEGDATTFNFQETFDVIILSNVLEHIEKRIGFLRRIKKLAPKMLIRVPLITRDWVSVYKKNSGFNYKLDNTHFIEYTEESFREEMEISGLKIESFCIKFGELYAVILCNTPK